jgi:hypothetical protein
MEFRQILTLISLLVNRNYYIITRFEICQELFTKTFNKIKQAESIKI